MVQIRLLFEVEIPARKIALPFSHTPHVAVEEGDIQLPFGEELPQPFLLQRELHFVDGRPPSPVFAPPRIGYGHVTVVSHTLAIAAVSPCLPHMLPAERGG